MPAILEAILYHKEYIKAYSTFAFTTDSSELRTSAPEINFHVEVLRLTKPTPVDASLPLSNSSERTAHLQY